jgi:hypothetical protein
MRRNSIATAELIFPGRSVAIAKTTVVMLSTAKHLPFQPLLKAKFFGSASE